MYGDPAFLPRPNHWISTAKGLLRSLLSLFKFGYHLPAFLRWWIHRTFSPALSNLHTYRYSPLASPRDIRVLVLHGGVSEEDIHCSLRAIPLDDAIRYEALSYTWGDPTEIRRLRCGDASLDVTVNLYSALQHLRYPYSERVIWADAICINQNDLKERESQVQLMVDVYSSASRVIMWLGEDTEGVFGAFQGIKWVRSLFPEGIPSVAFAEMSTADIERILDDIRRLLTSERGPDIQRLLLLMGHLLQRSWFTRKWVIQEIVKARTGLLVCGSLSLPWSELQDGMAFLKYTRAYMLLFGVGIDIPSESLDHIALIETMKNYEVHLTLDQILYLTRRFLVSLARDHVISILGLASDIDADDIRFLANYVAPTLDYFRLFIRWSIDKNRNLDCLSLGFDPANISDSSLPSWMPDFRSWDLQPGMPRSICGFKASLNASPIVLFSSEKPHFRVSGTILDQIDLLGKVPRDNRDLDLAKPGNNHQDPIISAHQLIMERDLDWLLDCKSVASTDSNSPDSPGFSSFCRTLVWNLPGITHNYSADELSNIFAQWMRETEGKAQDVSAAYIDATVISFIGTFSLGRRFARTAQGRLGSMPRFSAVGDKICLFDGGSLPYVIRPRGDGTYTFLGDCYLDGVMYGEAMVEGRRTEVFTLV
ncbi:heterokaryon incompatibility protein-domain-containing protein [Cadophora sp. MPI-SDFR-AT-0126]|nr:heterokaryon incompatibility protein-domain-containing protein [Leotiomycetes sp. MPI-SDFR-AT-0126]